MSSNKNVAIVIALSIITLSGVFLWKSNSALGVTNSAEFNQKILNSLAELNLPKSSDLSLINAAPDNLGNYIFYRSGVTLSQTNKDALRQSEQTSWSQNKRIGQSHLAQILTDVAFEKLVTLSDAEINDMSETLRGFNDASMSPTFQSGRRMVRLRANGEGSLEPQYFISQLAYARDAQIAYNLQRSGYPPLLIQANRAALYNRIVNEVSVRVNTLTAADPDFLDGSKNLTPTKAMLVSYAVVTNDMLLGNSTDIQQFMADEQQTISRFWNQQYPSPQGRKAYGVNGYVYSSPTNYLLDDSSVARVLTLINERSN